MDTLNVKTYTSMVRYVLKKTFLGIFFAETFELNSEVRSVFCSNVCFTSDHQTFVVYLRSDMSLSVEIMKYCRPLLQAAFKFIPHNFRTRQ